MNNKQYILIRFTGYNNYPINYLKYLLKENGFMNIDFMLAINEAVCNAARYNINDINTCKIKIILYFNENSVKVLVSSKTIPTSAYIIKTNLLKLKDKQSWSKHLKNKLRGRGFWIILAGVDNLYVKEDMQSILLVKKKRSSSLKNNDNMFELINKFNISLPCLFK